MALETTSPALDSHITLSNASAPLYEAPVGCPPHLADLWDVVYVLETPVCVKPELVGQDLVTSQSSTSFAESNMTGSTFQA